MQAMRRTSPNPAQAQNERTLVLRAQRGDRAAYAALVGRHEKLVFAVISRLVRPVGLGGEVEDLAQETFLRAHRALGRFDPDGSAAFRTWLLKIATNLALDRLKRRDHTEHRSTLRVVERQPFAADASERRRRLREGLERAVAKLGDEQRAVFVLREIHGLSYAEIGELLGLTASGARVRMFRAREVLIPRLEALREETHD